MAESDVDEIEGCTCWCIPDPFGILIPAAWWLLLPAISVQLKDKKAGNAKSVMGGAHSVCWLDADGSPERHLLVDTGSRFIAVAESQIAYAETLAPWLNRALVQWEPVARSLATEVAAASVWSGQPDGPLPVTAVLQGAGRAYVEVCVRRQLHDCVPGPQPGTG